MLSCLCQALFKNIDNVFWLDWPERYTTFGRADFKQRL
jgi:hypothetical protein